MATKELQAELVDAKNARRTPTPKRRTQTPSYNGDYTADSIKVLGGMEAVRKRPAMYIGSTGELGLHHLVYEVVDNSVDEALAGHADKIEVTIHLDNSITVVDNGRGIPVDNMDIDGEKIPAAQVVMTTLHAGGKFDSNSYKVSGGLHGVGVSCVNALSEELDLEIWRDGFTWEQTYSKGEPTSKLKKAGATKKRGTKVHFMPDTTIFTATEYNFDTLSQRLRELAFLNKGLVITLTDERQTDSKTGEAKRAEFKYNGGIAEFIKHLNRGKQTLHDKPIYMEADKDQVHIEIGLQYNDAYSESVFSFANNINTVDGGTHLSGFRTALTRTINYAGPADGPVQGRKGKSHWRRRPRRTGRGHQREAAAAAVRRPDQGQAQFRYRRHRAGRGQRKAGRIFRAEHRRRPKRSSTRPSMPPAPAKPPARLATSLAAKARSMVEAFPANLPTAPSAIPIAASCFWSKANPPAAPPNRAAIAAFRPFCRSREKFSTSKKPATTRCWRTRKFAP